ncbi:lamin tail domain-containing protein [Actinosynnema sp. NPDC050801]|uniref:lamin tail domain-containing protein n=1 Tax=unclassified Actinosynnema TaxID=2637065 RepID=UPI0033C52FEE
MIDAAGPRAAAPAQPAPRIRGGKRVAAVVTSLVAGALLPAPSASAAPVDTFGQVVRVVDGDTVIARIAGKQHRIRITGLNAMELTDYRPGHRDGECHARQATRRLESLVLDKRVRVTAREEDSHSGKRKRLRRSLAVQDAGGTWVDPAGVLIREGLALWMPNEVEHLPNSTYPVLAAQAAADGKGLWNTDACGVGPSRNASLRVTVQWQGAETASVHNTGAKPVSLAGWWLRDSSYHGKRGRGYTFPAATVVPAGGAVVLHTGKGSDTGGHYYWNLKNPVFDDVTGAPTLMADGAYLFDVDGDLRAAQQYAPHAPIQFP